jgi:hypothetical protein
MREQEQKLLFMPVGSEPEAALRAGVRVGSWSVVQAPRNKAVLGTGDILVRIRTRIYLWLTDPDLILYPTPFFNDFKDAKKNSHFLF